MNKCARILGIDPGSVTTGFGIVESDGTQNRYIFHGAIKTGEGTFPERLGVIYKQLNKIIEEWRPEEVAIEEVFVSRNASSALKLGQARGAAICACMSHRLPVNEYSARSVKQSVVGTGAANKAQVQHMVKVLLNIKGDLQADAADALAIALCHGHVGHNKLGIRLPQTRRRSKRA